MLAATESCKRQEPPLLRIPTGMQEMSLELWFPVMKMPSAHLMFKNVKLSKVGQDWELSGFPKDRQIVEIIWFKVISESAAVVSHLLW